MAGHQAILIALVLAFVCYADAEIKLQQVDRKINLAGQFARVSEIIKAKNTGNTAVARITLCKLAIQGDHAALETVTQQASDAKLKLSPVAAPGAPAEVICHEVALAHSIPAGETLTLTHTVVYSELQTALPAEVAQGEPQLMVYTDNVYVLSPYTVTVQATEVILPSSNVKSFTEEKPTAKSDKKIKYGKYDLVKPFTVKELRLHFENMLPFSTVLKCVREIEVSHWGNIYVEEAYELKHTGALHKGPFSRLRYMHNYGGKGNSFRDLKAVLPAAAHSLYYVDLIGNISSSNVRKSFDKTVLDFEMRYPLLGGWKVDFTLGYSLPLTGFLFRRSSNGQRRLTIDLSVPLEEVLVKELEVRVVLPEGSSDISTVLPFELQQSTDTKYTYLDTSGRPVVVLRTTNVVPEHAAKFSVDYSFASTSLLREPALLIGVFLALLLAVIGYNRMEFTLSKDEKWVEGQARERINTFMEQIQALLEDEEALVERLAKVSSAVTTSADVDHALKEKATVDAQLKTLDAQLRPLLGSVDGCSTRVGSQVREVVEKVRGLQARHTALLTERVDLARKGTPDISRKFLPQLLQLQKARADVEQELDTVFGAY